MEVHEGPGFVRRTWPAAGVRSLCWRGDELVDWVDGGTVYRLDGTMEQRYVNYAYRFNAALMHGNYAVIYEKLGTKALLLTAQGGIVRELNRSFYHAHVHEYPICLFTAPGGRTLLAHCPEHYNQLELEDAATGERLTGRAERKPADFFHSRLQANPSGTWLSSAGWIWHPIDAVSFYDVAEALRAPAALDTIRGLSHDDAVEEGAACWQSDERALISHESGISVYDVASGATLSTAAVAQPLGTLMSAGPRHAVCFYEHPTLIALDTGAVLHTWNEIDSGQQASSIIWGLDKQPPPLALDPARRRFAIASPSAISVVELVGDDRPS